MCYFLCFMFLCDQYHNNWLSVVIPDGAMHMTYAVVVHFHETWSWSALFLSVSCKTNREECKETLAALEEALYNYA